MPLFPVVEMLLKNNEFPSFVVPLHNIAPTLTTHVQLTNPLLEFHLVFIKHNYKSLWRSFHKIRHVYHSYSDACHRHEEPIDIQNFASRTEEHNSHVCANQWVLVNPG